MWVGPADVGATLEIHVEISSEFAKKTEINPSCQLGSEQLMQLLRLGVPLCSACTTASSTPLRRTLPSQILRLERSCSIVASDIVRLFFLFQLQIKFGFNAGTRERSDKAQSLQVQEPAFLRRVA